MTILDERQEKILCAVVQSYTELNAPVGSAFITKRFPIGLSPATVRHTMAKLEKLGYLTQPHTSAGRLPTELGYKHYVNTILREQSFPISTSFTKQLSECIRNSDTDKNSLLQEVARTLSVVSRHLALALPPRIEDITLKHIKFIKYSYRKVLCVLVSDEGIVKNIFVDLDKSCGQQQLDEISTYLNRRFRGLTIKEIRRQVTAKINRDRDSLNKFIVRMLAIFQNLTSPVNEEPHLLSGLSGTSYLPDFFDIDHVRDILKAIEDREFMLKLLHEIEYAHGTRVYVGMEKIHASLKDLSMVVSTYSDNRNYGGVIGIIGPTRMNYRQLIPVVDHTAKALTQILSRS
jgi:heat-inducible transcriptional repressor